MAEVGILDLQVNDNSQQAAESLKSIAEALIRVKTAVSNAEKIGEAGKQIAELATKINAYLGKSVMQKIDALGNALKGLQNLGKVTINIRENGGAKRVKDTLDSVKETSGGIGDSISDSIATGEERVNNVTEEIERLKSELAEGVQSGLFDDAKIDSYVNRLNELSGEYKNVAETVQNAGIAREVQDTFQEVGESVQDATGTVRQQIDELIAQLNTSQIPTRGFSDFVDQMLGIKRTMLDAKEAADVFMTDAEKQYMALIDQLNQEISYENFGKAIDEMMGIGKKASSAFDPLNTKLAAIAENNERIERVAKSAGEAWSSALQKVHDKTKKVYEETEKGIEATQRLKDIRYDEVTAATGDVYAARPDIPRSEIHAMPTDLTSNTPMAAALRGELGEKQYLSALRDEAKATGKSLEEVKARVEAYKNEVVNATPETDAFAEALAKVEEYTGSSEIDMMTRKLESMKSSLASGIASGDISEDKVIDKVMSIRSLTSRIEELKAKEEEAATTTHKLRDAFEELKSGIKGLGITKLLNQFMRMAKMRMMRYAIREIAKGFSEGVQNVYFYSKAIDGTFVKSMDSAATSLLQMKNSIGAAIAPVLQAIIPYLQIVVNWFISLVNWANQFFALLSGQRTWTRALPATTNAFDDQKKAAKGAAAAVKELLADWDELNIIQSETGGGGSTSGGSSATDYLNMFEQVATFNSRIKKIVDFIKDNFDTIKKTALDIASVLLAWKFSTLFTGTLADILGLGGAALTAKLVFDVSTIFTNKLLDTGDAGWLVADVLTTLVGSVFMKQILGKVLGGQASRIAIPLTFAVSAAATIIANVGRTDVDALSRESLLADVTAALEGGVVAGYIARMAGATLGESLLGGAIGTIATFGIAIGLKADAEVITDGITPNNIKAKLLAVAALGLSGAATGAALAEAGTAGAAATGMAMLFGGVPIATYGVAIGIHAINEVVDGSGITASVVKQNFISGGLVGAGLAISSASIFGATFGMLVGASAGALVIGALFVIEAIIDKQPVKVRWGNYAATKEEIEAFVSNDIFNDPPSVVIKKINMTVDSLTQSKTHLSEDIQGTIGTLSVIPVSISTTQEDLKAEIDQLVSDFNNASEQYQNTLEVALSLVPVKNENEEDQSKEIVKNSAKRWDDLSAIMTGLGEDLADAYSVAYDARLKGNIDKEAEETIKQISNMMTRVAEAISTGQARANASHALRTQLQNLSRESLNGILDEYKAQRDELIKELTQIRTDAAEGILAQQYAYEELARYRLEEVHGDMTDLTYQHYIEMAEQAKKDYESALANMQQEVREAADSMLDKDMMQEFRQDTLGYLKRTVSLDNWLNTGMLEGMQDLFAGEDSVLLGNKAKWNVYSLLTQYIQASFTGEDKNTVKKAIDSGVLKFTDYVNKEMTDRLADQLGITGELKNIWDRYVEELGIANPQLDKWHMEGAGNVEPVTPDYVMKLQEPVKAAAPDMQAYYAVLDEAGLYTEGFVKKIQRLLQGLQFEWSLDEGSRGFSSHLHIRPIATYASGGFPKSGDLVMADENGNFEMKGRMGNQPVVANNQQIVDGISKGVSNANGDVVSELRVLATMMQRMLSKEFVARAVPSSGWARNNEKSAQAYDRVTG